MRSAQERFMHELCEMASRSASGPVLLRLAEPDFHALKRSAFGIWPDPDGEAENLQPFKLMGPMESVIVEWSISITPGEWHWYTERDVELLRGLSFQCPHCSGAVPGTVTKPEAMEITKG